MRQKPGLVNQFRKTDGTTACPRAVQARGDDQRIVEEIFHVQVRGCPVSLKRLTQPRDNQIVSSIAQPGILECGRSQLVHVHDDAWVSRGKAFDELREYRGNNRLG